MPRAFFPHTLSDVIHAIDGAFGLIVGDMADGTIWVLKRDRRTGTYALTHYGDTTRKQVLSTEAFPERVPAINAMAQAIGLGESLPG